MPSPSAPIYGHSRARGCAHYALTYTHTHLRHAYIRNWTDETFRTVALTAALFGLILAFRDSGQSPSDFWQNGIARNGHYLSRYAYVRTRVKGWCELTNTDAAGILCTLALIMLALVPAKRNCYTEGCSMRSGLIYRALIILHLLLDRSKPASTYKIIRIEPYTSTFTSAFLLLFSVNARLDATKPRLYLAIRAPARLRDREKKIRVRTMSRWVVANWSRWDRFISLCFK